MYECKLHAIMKVNKKIGTSFATVFQRIQTGTALTLYTYMCMPLHRQKHDDLSCNSSKVSIGSMFNHLEKKEKTDQKFDYQHTCTLVCMLYTLLSITCIMHLFVGNIKTEEAYLKQCMCLETHVTDILLCQYSTLFCFESTSG